MSDKKPELEKNSESDSLKNPFEQVLGKLPIFLMFFVIIGMFWFAKRVKDLSNKEVGKVILTLNSMSLTEIITYALKDTYGITIKKENQKEIVCRDQPKCKYCQAEMDISAGKTYSISTRNFLANLNLSNILAWFPEHIHLQRWKCTNTKCNKYGSGLSQRELPYSKQSDFTMNWVFQAYLSSCASFRSIVITAKAHNRPMTAAFIWHSIQRLGKLFNTHRNHCKPYFTGIIGTDECYPRTIKGKTGIVSSIDQNTGLIVGSLLHFPFSSEDITKHLKELLKASVPINAMITDLSVIYPGGVAGIDQKILHIGCIVHIYRNLKTLKEKGLKKIARIRDSRLVEIYTKQIEFFTFLIPDIFHSSTSKEAHDKITALLNLQDKYTSNPGLEPFFKYLRNHQEILTLTHHGWNFPIHNNYIERFFGHIRHKLKIVRGWKKDETLLSFVNSLAIYRNFLALQLLDAKVPSAYTGKYFSICNLSFAEYLIHCLPDAGIGAITAIRTHNSDALSQANKSLSNLFPQSQQSSKTFSSSTFISNLGRRISIFFFSTVKSSLNLFMRNI